MVEASGDCVCGGECRDLLTCRPGTYGPDDPGGGQYDHATGVRDWYLPAPASTEKPTGGVDFITHWPLVELDLQDMGIDVESGVLHQRSWAWLQLRLVGIASTPTSRLYAATHPKGK